MQLIGHEKISNFLDKCIKRNSLANAYLFSGPESVGKFKLASEFVKKIQKIKARDEIINPDIIIISPELDEKKGMRRKDISIGQIREMERAFSLSSYFGGLKIAIVDDADRMTVSAQNALLKTLEEPPKDCVVILVSHDAEKILPTIKSRCVHKKFNLVGEEKMSGGLKLSAEMKKWSIGRPGLAIKLLEDKQKYEEMALISEEFKLAVGGNMVEKMELAQELAKDASKLAGRLNYWMVFLRQNIMHKGAPSSSRKNSLAMIGEIYAALRLLKETNSNPRTILENLFLQF